MEKHACPSCGATLGIPDVHERVFTCSFCGTVLEDKAVDPAAPEAPTATSAPTQITIVTNWADPSSLPSYSGTAARGCGLLSLGITLAVIAAITVGAYTLVGGIGDTVNDVIDEVTSSIDGVTTNTGTVVPPPTAGTPPAGEPAASSWYLADGSGLGDGTYPALSTAGVRDGDGAIVTLVILTTGAEVTIRNDDWSGETTFLGANEATITITGGHATVQFDP